MKTIFLITIVVILTSSFLYAGEYFGIGIHGGFHYDVGNLTSKPDINLDTQINYMFGGSIKFDSDPLFIRIGNDYTLLAGGGSVKDNSYGKLTEVNIQYISIPFHTGVNFPVYDTGKFFIGIGGTYIIGKGSITTTDGKFEISDKQLGLSFIIGGQIKITEIFRTYLNLIYSTAGSDPLVSISGTWKDFSVDYSGMRVHLGISLYFI